MSGDRFLVTILPDGTIRTETGAIGAVNHSSVDTFLRDVAILAGGKVERRAREQGAALVVQAREGQTQE